MFLLNNNPIIRHEIIYNTMNVITNTFTWVIKYPNAVINAVI